MEEAEGVVLLEDKLIEKEKQEKVLEKLEDKKVVGMSWLSKSIAEGKKVGMEEYIISEKKKIKTVHALSDEEESPVKVNKKTKKGTDMIKESNKVHQMSDSESDDNQNTTQEPAEDTKPGQRVDLKHHVNQTSGPTNSASSSPNGHIADQLAKLAKAYTASGDRWRARSYSRAVTTLTAHPTPIKNKEQALALPGIGKALADKILEMVESGKIRKVEEVTGTEQSKVLELFSGVWGAGPATAQAWWDRGLRTLESLETVDLTRQQRVGLRLYKDLNTRMARQEAGRLAKLVREEAEELLAGVEVTACPRTISESDMFLYQLSDLLLYQERY